MGDGTSALLEGGNGAKAGRESGQRRRRAGIDLHKRLPGYLPGLHDASRGSRAPSRALRLPRRNGQRSAPKDTRPGAPCLAGRLSR